MSRIATALIVLTSLVAGCTGTPKLLPHPLYFRDGPEGQLQVWRLEADGVAKAQVTHEQAEVSGYAVSPTDGSLAFVSDNHLFLVDGEGENRRLIADDSQVDKEAEDYVFRGFIGDPVFSPDGRTLAYAFDGLHLYDLATGTDEHVLTNLGHLLGESYVFAEENYSPGPWSPDGSKLLILMGYFEGTTLAVMELGAQQPFTRLRTEGPACCLFSWTMDSRTVLVANPYFTMERPGLWAYDTQTGQGTVLMMGPAEGHPNDYVGWPYQLASGALVYFYVNLERFSPDVGIPLQMVRSDPDGSNRIQLRPEEFRIVEVLWAEDGSSAVVLGLNSEELRQVVLARTDGSPLNVLLEGNGIRDLAWGP